MKKHKWGIPIHDAIVCSPAAAADARQWYADGLNDIYENRETILKDYFSSIGITAAATEQWTKLKTKIVPFEGDFDTSLMALK